MKFPLSWLKDEIDIPAGTTAEDIGQILTDLGFEVESIEHLGLDISGPVIVGKVLSFVEEPQKNGKTIRWCQVDDGTTVRGIVCGASNFLVDDLVVVALPGAVLPGNFVIAARETYGHTSDGMICSARELGLGDDHNGIIRLGTFNLTADLGADAIELLQIIDDVIDVSVLPDRGYAMSIRGISREIAAKTSWKWSDRANLIDTAGAKNAKAVGVRIEDRTAADRIVIRTIENYQPETVTPYWMQRRIQLCGMRPISLAVDVTNYVMLELGQPLHAFDADKLQGDIQVRSAGKDTQITTLDGVERRLYADDIVIVDDSGVIGLAGTMGGASTEISEQTRRIALEAAHFFQTRVALTSRRHKLGSEASRRFERGVDPLLAPIASARASQLLRDIAGAQEIGAVEVNNYSKPEQIVVRADFAKRIIGSDYSDAEIMLALQSVGCIVSKNGERFNIVSPSWRSDLLNENDFAEEVARFFGYERIGINQPPAAFGGRNLALEQRRRALNFLAQQGLVEVLNYPFVGDADFDRLGISADDPRRLLVQVANPLNAEQAGLRTTLLPGLLSVMERNFGRGAVSIPVYEFGTVFLDKPSSAPIFETNKKPAEDEIKLLFASVGMQPRYLAALATGRRFSSGKTELDWDWISILSLVRNLAKVLGVYVEFRQTQWEPWHPGRSAAVITNGNVIGFVGEMHPELSKTLSISQRIVGFEIDFDALIERSSVVQVKRQSNLPFIEIDVSLIVDEKVTVQDLIETAWSSDLDIIESVNLSDVYRGKPIEEGKKSVTINLLLRSMERTLRESEAVDLRTNIVKLAEEKFGAYMRDVN